MTGLQKGVRFRTAIGLIAAYAIALQAVFTTLAPMQVQADGTIAAYCSGSAAVTPGTEDPNAPSPVPAKMQCVFCGACPGGFAILPAVSDVADLPVERPLSLVPAAPDDRTAAIHVRDGPARAPPLTV
jgi:hypothetical protein